MSSGHQPISGDNPPKNPPARYGGGKKGQVYLPTIHTPLGDVKTLSEWREFARRDDCLNLMVPSDLRIILGNLR